MQLPGCEQVAALEGAFPLLLEGSFLPLIAPPLPACAESRV